MAVFEVFDPDLVKVKYGPADQGRRETEFQGLAEYGLVPVFFLSSFILLFIIPKLEELHNNSLVW